ncbi:uncharacterized protein LOC113501149 isoform X2 [Trichoplusia ni]|uniref:Uncharacterized protein LOC113501149 isoform X2 n=1 Tax=Trichoplusia ni TaxID=7111 RepID=A0A7E5WBD7_TRINI|nr:uncharacterized protein LOC113501149 isoform X2 [Trichoplusia ni]
MNSMNHISHCNLRLCSRNEGKIKSYESCRDVRAWSHDVQKRDHYLREWIKCDMPICVLPTSTLASFLRTMTCRSRGRATPRCHPDCKSKVVLDSICNSCHVIKECFKNEEEFEKYFEDEEFETSHWPCERCLEALKSIKMFWKIIVEKIFNVNVSKEDDNCNECCRTSSVRSVAKIWQTEMVHQALFVKNITPLLSRTPNIRGTCLWKGTKTVKKEVAPCNLKPCIIQDGSDEPKKEPCKLKNFTIKSYKVQSTDTDCLSNPMVIRPSKTNKKTNRQCSAKVKMVETGCEACGEPCDDIKAYKNNCEILQEKCNCQKKEIDKLKRENSSLKIELQNVYKNSSWKSAFYTPSSCTGKTDSVALLPKPFECCPEENADSRHVKDIDSEMYITIKNCTNETYRHISLLQVLHKSNGPILNDMNLDSSCCYRKEDPIEVLTKVQNTFGEIVKHEMNKANNKKCTKCNLVDINASYHKVNGPRSVPSCSTITLASSDSHGDYRLIQS